MTPSLDASSLFRVDGMVAVITGGGTGIGLIMARALAINGASKVFILGRRLGVLEEAAAAHQGPGSLIPVQCDVSSKQSLQAAVDRVAAEAGHVNLLVANSGKSGPNGRWDPTLSVQQLREALFVNGDMDAFTDTLHVNTTAAFFTLLAFLDLLAAGNEKAKAGSGFGAPGEGLTVPQVQSQVVFTASIASFMRATISPAAYVASKAALMQLTKHAATGLAMHGIRANALAPGYHGVVFPSELAAGMIGNRKPETEGPDNPLWIPASRFGREEDMAGSILYLASKAGGFCNGLILMMDGGRLATTQASY